MDFETVSQQRKLPPRPAVYWRGIAKGEHLGFRKAADGSVTWWARYYDPTARVQHKRSLGDFPSVPANERFTEASRAAAEWFKHLRRGGSTEVVTVGEAFKRYVEHQREQKGEAQANDADARYKRHVEGDPIANVPLAKLKAEQMAAWRKRIERRPADPPKRGPKCRNRAELPPPATRSKSTVNRDLVGMRAALNMAHKLGFVVSDLAWKTSLKPAANVDGRRDVYLARDQRRALIDALEQDDIRAFVTGLCLLPLRPGALAALNAGDFNARAGTLHIPTDKAGAGRTILLPQTAAALIRKQVKDKLPGAPLFARSNGSAWEKHHWKGPIKTAAAAAGLPAGTVAYALRHSVITDLITPKHADGSEAQGLDLFTVAALSGTSVAMIEKHYGHLQQQRARDALAGLAL